MLALTKAPLRMVLAPRAASKTRVPFVVERATVEPGGISEPRISVGELPKSKPATFALPRSPMRKSVSAAPSTEATGTILAPLETRTAIVVLALKASTTTTTEPARAALRAPLSPPAKRAITAQYKGASPALCDYIDPRAD